MISYFDYAATSFRKPWQVYKAIRDYKRFGVSIGRGNNKKSRICENRVEETREMLKQLVKADDTYKTIFQPSATYALNLLIQGLDYSRIRVVYISPYEHNSVTRPIYKMREKYNFEIEILRNHKEQFKTTNPDLVIMSHVSNAFGIIQDYESVFCEAKKYDAITILDMAQSFGLVETNISKGKADAVVFAGHKTLYGFNGVGGAIISNKLKMEELIQGGTGIESARIDMPLQRPIRYEAGTANILGIFSLYYSCKYLLKKTYIKITDIENKNFTKLKSVLKRFDFLEVIEPRGKCTSIVACRVKNYSPDNFTKYFTKYNIAIRVGLQCSPNAHREFGTFPEGTIRFSIGLFNKNRDFKQLQKALKSIENQLNKGNSSKKR